MFLVEKPKLVVPDKSNVGLFGYFERDGKMVAGMTVFEAARSTLHTVTLSDTSFEVKRKMDIFLSFPNARLSVSTSGSDIAITSDYGEGDVCLIDDALYLCALWGQDTYLADLSTGEIGKDHGARAAVFRSWAVEVPGSGTDFTTLFERKV